MYKATIQVPEEWNGMEIPPPITLQLRPTFEMTPDQLLVFATHNDDLHFELTADGELIVMTPGGRMTGLRNVELTIQLLTWAKQNDLGQAFSHTVGFILKGNAVRAPSASWTSRERRERRGPGDRDVFPALCPDFVVELRWPNHNLGIVRAKMDEYLENDLRLGWLIDPVNRRVSVYRPETAVQILDAPETIWADPLLPGFVLDLRPIWQPEL